MSERRTSIVASLNPYYRCQYLVVGIRIRLPVISWRKAKIALNRYRSYVLGYKFATITQKSQAKYHKADFSLDLPDTQWHEVVIVSNRVYLNIEIE
ncbi:hypothetical protein LRB66_02510 [Borreliella burgdorferi]|uniref:hypothetical protein n=1 Tax=Borreliella burgdorferi TaxID=139 RepID=UPI00052A27E0|nr:hypothetical protein [Borreliella burgdorferi]MCD2399417.1 hypothetical protein [Borreliella burgdorferi]MCD2400280.1 hypothetical protein [Borreliella burgdorferi]MCD2402852.1 hypothetical protein [Borreliella burgdorferi]MCD2402959.1 hypothetical protein [Borreliella burgdorferi]MCD2404632.1 hypothetical protein [Borreliella burgdorferi]